MMLLRALRPAGALWVVILCLANGSIAPAGEGGTVFRRGDANSSGQVDISDAIYIFDYLSSGGEAPLCPGLANANGTDDVDISDGIHLLNVLFLGIGSVPPLNDPEIEQCTNPRPPEVVRHGSFSPVAHEVSGRVQQLSNRKIRLTNFYYDGSGEPMVVVWLYKSSANDVEGRQISPDLRRLEPYLNATLEFDIPGDIPEDAFNYVSIWCTFFPLNYGFARLFPGA